MYSGLSTQKARQLLKKYGRNEIKTEITIHPLKLFLSQFTSPLIVILIVAALISWLIHYFPKYEEAGIDAVLIILIVIVSGIAGFIQEYKSEKTVHALKKLATPKAKVIRDNQEREIPASELVVGDIVILETGDVVPADVKILKTQILQIDESLLTGESKAVTKKEGEEAYLGTAITFGKALAQIVRTGMKTRLGEIAFRLQTLRKEQTPFQIEITNFSKKAVKIILVLILIFALISLFKYSFYQSILTAISLAVAAIPEGLPVVLVLVLALGAQDMARKKALIRKLAAVESIGAVDIICTDKTGTLTKNEMTLRSLFFNNALIKADEVDQSKIDLLLRCTLLCNNARQGMDAEGNRTFIGDQTEIAFLKFAQKLGLLYENIRKDWKRISEIPFSSERKMMSVITKSPAQPEYVMFTKGAPEIVLKKCDFIYQENKILPLSLEGKNKILDINNQLAQKGLRILGFAFKKGVDKNLTEEKLCWLGLVALMDPPRKEAIEAIRDCKTAGIRVIMITGDNKLTAQAIAEEVGLKSTKILEGFQLDKMSDKELAQALDSKVNIFARTSPFHKLRILKILQKKNRVAMTGDGVNDALALKKADVGIAMGKSGTQVAREASDIILLDDNFATIRSAIKEGRRIFDNIRKFINYLLTSNFAEIAVLFGAATFLPFREPILLPVHILWINFLTDGLPAIALGLDPANKDIMKKPPRKKEEGILTKRLLWLIGIIGTKKTLVLLATFLIMLPFGFELARTTLFTGFILYEFVRISTIRYQEKLNWLSNPWLIVSLIVSLILQLFIIYSPLNEFFHTTPLNPQAWLVLAGGIIIGYTTAIALTKLVISHTPA